MPVLRALLAALLALLSGGGAQADGRTTPKLLIFAAASLTDAVARIADAFEKQTNITVSVSFAGTQQLARQIEAGAPAAIFISADWEWMEWMAGRGLISGEPLDFAGNRLVVAVRNETENWADIAPLFTESRFAMADPASVPAGRYARQALEASGWWERAQERAVFGENVRVALKRVALGEVAAAIVYATDAMAEPGVRALTTFDENLHAPIRYWAAATGDASDEAKLFLDFLAGERAQQILTEAGFQPPPAKQ